MKNLVIVGISDTADRIARFVERYSLYNIIGCTVNKEYIPEGGMAEVGGVNRKVFPLEELDKFIDKENDLLFVAVLWNRLNADRRYLYEKLNRWDIILPISFLRKLRCVESCWEIIA